ncbi:MAG: signal peptidase I [Planctomycetes bacterium]|nr:signal peptidase I [Planctomycetota bacterium]
MSFPSSFSERATSNGRRRIFLWLGLLGVLLVEPLRFAPVFGASMEPTLRAGDLVCFDRISSGEVPNRGSVVVFQSPLDPKRLFVKRIIGLPGDKLRFEAGELSINGAPYALKPKARDPKLWLSVRVPEGHFFALGDHAQVSYDSRRFGCVRLDHLVGRLIGF